MRFDPRAFTALLAGALALLCVGLGQLDLWEPDEPRIAQVADELRSMEHGPRGLVVLHLNGAPYTQKPPLYYWLAAALGSGSGRVTEVAARLPSALAGVAVVALVAGFGARLLGPTSGLLGAALLLTVYRFAYLARRAQLDVLLCLFEMLALLAFWRLDRGLGRRRANVALLHGALGLAVLTKGPVGFLVPMLVAAAYLAWEGRLREIGRAAPAWSLLLSLGPALAWLGAATALAPQGFLGEALGSNLLGRFFAGTSHARPLHYYLLQLPLEFLPWTLLWPAVLAAGRRGVLAPGAEPARRRAWRFLLAWLGATFVFFSLSSGKRGLYLLPAFPAAALLCADALLDACALRGRVPVWIARAAAALGGLLAAAGLAAAAASRAGALPVPVPAAFALALPVAVAGAAFAWRALARSRPALRFGAIVAGAWAIELSAFALALPALDPQKSPRAIADVVAARSAPDERVGLVGDAQKTAGLAYYGARRIVPLEGPEDVRRFLDAGGRMLVVRRKKLSRVEAVTPVEIHAAVRGGDREFVVVSPRGSR